MTPDNKSLPAAHEALGDEAADMNLASEYTDEASGSNDKGAPNLNIPYIRQSLMDLFRHKRSTVQIGDVCYYDGAELSRPLEMPPIVRYVTVVAMLIAAILGALFVGNYLDKIMNEPIRQQEALSAALTRDVAVELPPLASIMPLDDEGVMTYLMENGYTLYERTPLGTNPDGGFEVIKLPSDISLEEAEAMYVTGIDRLSAPEAVTLLKGSWNLTVQRKLGADMRVRYADFESGTIERATQNAMQAEGLANATVTETGVDGSGNTFQAGTVTTEDGSTYNWRVSVIDLSRVYSIMGLPNTAYYVGVRFTV